MPSVGLSSQGGPGWEGHGRPSTVVTAWVSWMLKCHLTVTTGDQGKEKARAAPWRYLLSFSKAGPLYQLPSLVSSHPLPKMDRHFLVGRRAAKCRVFTSPSWHIVIATELDSCLNCVFVYLHPSLQILRQVSCIFLDSEPVVAFVYEMQKQKNMWKPEEEDLSRLLGKLCLFLKVSHEAWPRPHPYGCGTRPRRL